MRTRTLKRYPNLPGKPLSVTAILDLAFPRPGLQGWRERTAAELARKFPDESAVGLLERHRGPEMGRGKAVHKAIEQYLLGIDGVRIPNDAVAVLFGRWVEWWLHRDMDLISAELTVMGDDGTWAGTLDALAFDDGGPNVGTERAGEPRVVLDWKTCTTLPKAPWSHHCAQVAAYADGGIWDVWDRGWTPLGTVHYGVIVYISTEGVRAFDVAGDDWLRAQDMWDHCLALAKAAFPEVFDG